MRRRVFCSSAYISVLKLCSGYRLVYGYVSFPESMFSLSYRHGKVVAIQCLLENINWVLPVLLYNYKFCGPRLAGGGVNTEHRAHG